jgi:hypothetical protein
MARKKGAEAAPGAPTASTWLALSFRLALIGSYTQRTHVTKR